MKAYRVLTGTAYVAPLDAFFPTVFHMTFYAKDKDVLKYLIFVSGSPSGRIIPARNVKQEEEWADDYPPEQLPN